MENKLLKIMERSLETLKDKLKTAKSSRIRAALEKRIRVLEKKIGEFGSS
jgi:uncharacterized protein (DUF2267 family)